MNSFRTNLKISYHCLRTFYSFFFFFFALFHRESINMGFTDLTEDQVNVLIKDISREFIGNTYNLLTR